MTFTANFIGKDLHHQGHLLLAQPLHRTTLTHHEHLAIPHHVLLSLLSGIDTKPVREFVFTGKGTVAKESFESVDTTPQEGDGEEGVGGGGGTYRSIFGGGGIGMPLKPSNPDPILDPKKQFSKPYFRQLFVCLSFILNCVK